MLTQIETMSVMVCTTPLMMDTTVLRSASHLMTALKLTGSWVPSRGGAEDGVDSGLDVLHGLDTVVVQLLAVAVIMPTLFVAFVARGYALPLAAVRWTTEAAGWVKRVLQVIMYTAAEALHPPAFVTVTI